MAGVPFLTPQLGASAELIVEAAWGADLTASSGTWTWSDITTAVRQANGQKIGLTLGRGDETSQASPASCTFQLDNTTGTYTPYSPASSLYPNVRRNTPIRVRANLGAGAVTRFFGFANGFVPSWDVSARLAVVTVSASGVLRRLTQGRTPLRSPLYRLLSGTSPVAYWPLEDGVDSTQAAPGLTGGAPMTVADGVMDFIDGGPAGSDGAAQPEPSTSNALTGPVVGGSSTAWQLSVWAKGVRTDPTTGGYFVACEVRTSNGKIFRIILQEAGSVTAGWAHYVDEAATTAANEIDALTGQYIDTGWHLFQATMSQSGANASASFYIDGALVGSATWAGVTIGQPLLVSAIGDFGGIGTNISLNMQTINIAHIGVWNTATLVDQYDAGLGYAGELATDRLTRLCAEQDVPLTTTGTSTTTMGIQTVAAFVELLRECEAADGGVLYDGFSAGVGYITNSTRYNQATALTLDMSADRVSPPFAPVDDDQRNRNLVKVDRKSGSSATFTDTTGPLGTNTIGVYDTSLTVNVGDDGVLLDRAGWEVHRGTVEGLRYPNLNVDLAANPSLASAWLATTLTERVDVTNVTSKATQHPPGTVSLLLEGYTETLSPFNWSVAGNCSPYAPWRVFQISAESGDTSEYAGRLDTDGSTLAASCTTTATSLSVATATGNALWTTVADNLPFDITIDGEQIRVTAVSGASSPQTFTVTRSINGVVKTHSSGATVFLWAPLVLAL